MVLLGVLLILAAGSVWTRFAWQQVFAQQRMMQHQTLEALAWQAAESGAMQLWQQALNASGQPVATWQWPASTQQPNPVTGAPASQWHLKSPPQFDTASDTWWLHISGEVISETGSSLTPLSQAQLLLRIGQTSLKEGAVTRVTGWQRVYPK